MLILYTMGFMKVNRFNQIRTYVPEITPSLLAKRLAQLEEAGYVKRHSHLHRSRTTTWELTERGIDTIPIIARMIAHSSKWRAGGLFEDMEPRDIWQIFSLETIEQALEIRTA